MKKQKKMKQYPFLKATPVFNIAQVDLSECTLKFDNTDNVNKVD